MALYGSATSALRAATQPATTRWSFLILLLCAAYIECQMMALDEGLLDPRQPIINFRTSGQSSRGLLMDVRMGLTNDNPENTINGVLLDNAQHTNDILVQDDDGLTLVHHDIPLQEIHPEHIVGTDKGDLLGNKRNNYILTPDLSGNILLPATLLVAADGTYSSVVTADSAPESEQWQPEDRLRVPTLLSYGNGLYGTDTLHSELTADGSSLTDNGAATFMTNGNDITQSSGLVFATSNPTVSLNSNTSPLLMLQQPNANGYSDNMSGQFSGVGEPYQIYQTQPITDSGLQTLGTDIHGHTSGLPYGTSDASVSYSSNTSPLLMMMQQPNANGYSDNLSGTSSGAGDLVQTYQNQPITDSGLQTLGTDIRGQTSGLPYGTSDASVSYSSNTQPLLITMDQHNDNGYSDNMIGTSSGVGDLVQTYQTQPLTDSALQTFGTQVYGQTSGLQYAAGPATLGDTVQQAATVYSNTNPSGVFVSDSVTPFQTQTIMSSGQQSSDDDINGQAFELQYQTAPVVFWVQ